MKTLTVFIRSFCSLCTPRFPAICSCSFPSYALTNMTEHGDSFYCICIKCVVIVRLTSTVTEEDLTVGGGGGASPERPKEPLGSRVEVIQIELPEVTAFASMDTRLVEVIQKGRISIPKPLIAKSRLGRGPH